MKIEGRNSVFELLKTDTEIDKIMVENGLRDAESRKLLDEIRSKKVRVQFVDKTVLDKESERRKHQGFIAFTPDYKYADLESIIYATKDKDGFVVLLDEILDPHN